MNQPENIQPELQRLLAGMKAYLDSVRLSGIRVLSPYQRIQSCVAKEQQNDAETLEAVRDDLGICSRCGLCRHRTTIIFGQGNPRARLVFVGQAPTLADDSEGQAFSGAEGDMLTNIITRVIKSSRCDVYLSNIVKCSPPDGRIPDTDEILACIPFLRRQLAAIRPSIVCALGQVAAQALLGSDSPLDELRGRFYRAGDMLVMPTHDPAFLLVHEDKKRETWGDMQIIVRELAKNSIRL